MSIETATQRLKAANPAPETDPVRGEADDLTELLLATWQRSTNVQTQQPKKLAPVDEPQRRGWLIAVAVAAVTIIVIGAVALLSPSVGPREVADTPTTTLDAAPTSTTSAVVQAGPVTVVVEAYDYGFGGLPAEFTAGDAIELVNTSPTEYHNLVVIQLDDGDARSIEDFAALPPDSFGAEVPQPGFSIVGGLHAAPGEEAFDGRIRLQTPGRYLVIDMVPQGADATVVEETVNPPDSSDGGGAPYKLPGGSLGYEHGMIAIVTVTTK
jgi:hypothetical protein